MSKLKELIMAFMCEERESFHKDASLIGWNLLMKELN